MPHTSFAFEFFLGIDFSKGTLDLCLIDLRGQEQLASFKVKNTLAGFTQLERRLHSKSGVWKAVNPSNLMVIGDNTGRYSQLISLLFSRSDWQFWLASPLDINYAKGFTRGKTDAADALQIAQYGRRHSDKLKAFTPPSKTLVELDVLLRQFEHIKRKKTAYSANYKATSSTLGLYEIALDEQLQSSHQQVLKHFEDHMRLLEKKMLE